MITIYGIANCDTVRKALKWLEANKIAHQFYDFKKLPLTEELLAKFLLSVTWEEIINKRSTSYRQLTDQQKQAIADGNFATVTTTPTLLKRPLLQINEQIHLGFKPEQYQELLLS